MEPALSPGIDRVEIAAIDPDDPLEAAAVAGLRYVSDERPGIRRRKNGKGFSYTDPRGNVIKDSEERARLDSLAIPPAWEDVWICPDPRGHLQATGRDDRGRKQYRYHPRWREVRDATKFYRMVEFAEALPAIRGRVRRDLAREAMPREKVLAAVVRLLETTCIRVGNDAYRRENDSFGLTTLRTRHVELDGTRVAFHFKGKGGREQEVELEDERMAAILRECQEIPGYEVFQYLDDEGRRHRVDSDDVNDYLQDGFTAKDFRTWIGSVHALRALREEGPAATKKERKTKLLRAVDHVAEQLANTRAVCRQAYIHPEVLVAYGDGTLFKRLEAIPPEEIPGLRKDERLLLAFLVAS